MRKLTLWTESGPLDLRPDYLTELAEARDWEIILCLYPDFNLVPAEEHAWKQPIIFALAGTAEFIDECYELLRCQVT
jgi:hypothetical protein